MTSLFDFEECKVQPIEHAVFKEKNISVDIKRDDEVDYQVSGNKWRKLKYNIEKLQHKNYTTLLTFGGAFSNHLIATAKAGKLLNIKTIGVVRGEESPTPSDTLLACREYGMELHFISREDYKLKEELFFLDSLRQKFGSFYLVPEGGDNHYGALGCSELVKEVPDYDFYVCAAGTGTTAAGITMGLKRKEQRVLTFNALKNPDLNDRIRKQFFK